MSQQLLLIFLQPIEQDQVNRNSILSTIAILVGIAVGLATLGGFLHKWAKNRVEDLIRENNGSHETLNNMCTKLDKYHEVSLQALGATRLNRESLDRHLEGHPPRGG